MNKKINNLLLFITLLLISANVMAGSLTINDSTGVEKKDGKVFILHKVDPKETLFSISKKYGASVDDIKKYNPAAASGLKVGQIIKVPSKATASKAPDNTKTTHTQNKSNISTPAKNPQTHKVEPKETLYSISKKYSVTVDELKKANPEIAAGLKPGQIINIPSAGGQSDNTVKTDKTTTAVTNNPDKTNNAVKTDKNNQNLDHVISDVENNNTNTDASKKQEDLSNIKPSSNKSTEGGYTKITETGVAELMNDNANNPKYMALHRTAAVGTIVEVLNQSNNQKIFVKVIGPLTDPAESNVIIRLSQKAFQRLSGDKQIKVEISYIP
jgi:LysM repeat protein